MTDFCKVISISKSNASSITIDRCRTQFKLTREFEQNMDRMTKFIDSL